MRLMLLESGGFGEGIIDIGRIMERIIDSWNFRERKGTTIERENASCLNL